MVGTALITGASSGIGRELARVHARRGGDVVLVARRIRELELLAGELETEHDITAHVVATDLTQPDAPGRLHAWTTEKGINVEVLANNAGYGDHGDFIDRDIDTQLGMVRLNVEALVALTHLYLPGMVARGRGRILQVGSTAGFLPCPGMAVYYASKAFVNSFSQALNEELRHTDVRCTVLCPGPVDTEFGARASVEESSAFKQAITAEKTARAGYNAMLKGRPVVVVPRRFAALRFVGLAPRRVLLSASRKAMESD